MEIITKLPICVHILLQSHRIAILESIKWPIDTTVYKKTSMLFFRKSVETSSQTKVFQLERVDVSLWQPCCFSSVCVIYCLLFNHSSMPKRRDWLMVRKVCSISTSTDPYWKNSNFLIKKIFSKLKWKTKSSLKPRFSIISFRIVVVGISLLLFTPAVIYLRRIPFLVCPNALII